MSQCQTGHRILSPEDIDAFHQSVWAYYAGHARNMPWRESHGPYQVIVSELMLQQTQVSRVLVKYPQFMQLFPSIERLAAAPLADVLAAWSGLGYNRRAKFLHQAARMVIEEFGGRMPATEAELTRLPGIGRNTAGAILAYAFNQPVVFLETNIRTVLLHHFFKDDDQVTDGQLCGAASQVMDLEHPREWYWALMDYGTHLKKAHGSQLGRSTAYRKQPPLKGSLREMRGLLVKRLVEGELGLVEMRHRWGADPRLEPALRSLREDGLITVSRAAVRLTAST